MSNPITDRRTQRIDPAGSGEEQTAVPPGWPPKEKKKKHHNLYGQLLERPRLREAFKRVKANGGAPGSDGVTIVQFEERLEENLNQIIQALRAKSYRPHPIKRVEIPKREGGTRRLGIPCVRDRVVQDNLRAILEKIFEPTFSDHSHGFRPGRGCFTALKELFLQMRSGGVFIVDVDIKKCFDTIPHEPLIDAVAEEISDGSILNLIRIILTAPIDEGYRYVQRKSGVSIPGEGTAQGSPVSPLLANIYLAQLDKELEEEAVQYCRYADDIRATTSRCGEARKIKERIDEKLKSIGLSMNLQKTKLVSADIGVSFLGYRLKRYKKNRKIYAVIPRDRVNAFKERVRAMTRRSSHFSIGDRVQALGNYVGGWGEYFKRSQQPELFRKLDHWIYQRVIGMKAGRWRTHLYRKYRIWQLREDGVPGLLRLHLEHLHGPWVPKREWATTSCSA